jgi:hypothetical protein
VHQAKVRLQEQHAGPFEDGTIQDGGHSDLETATEEETLRLAAVRAFTLTLVDEGPDINNQPPRHWTSQDVYQQSRSIVDSSVTELTVPSFHDIAAGIQHLSLQGNSQSVNDTPSNPSASPADSIVEDIRCLSVEETEEPHIPVPPPALCELPPSD